MADSESQSRSTLPMAADDCAEVVRQRFAGRPAVPGQPEPDGEGFQVRRIEYGSDLYKALLELRQRVLRAPLGLSLWDENLTLESQQWHFAFLDTVGRPVACLTVVPLEGTRAKLRQMAVQPDCQGRGLGRQLLQAVEKVLKQDGFKTLELHARQSAVPFYEKSGYRVYGDIFQEVTIPHLKMARQLV
ncbi:GNAT family N-acetyltransferase [Pseudohongiella spirulinae]|uniref:Putative acetyltransferase n=1 Tax=Pseudohongiella spirulinae TaxID=1249552 RepID=A0A0S2KGL1_9GAMM|nr:GNAT family N-acetyltransferase [Pseudohongiella spirulinae]ALO47479.1 putative acetyltransferase [Pseudohongiella spirulinae]